MSYLGGRTIYIDSDGNEHFDYERDYEPKPITNADRIRAMTDEELAAFIEFVSAGCDYMSPDCPAHDSCKLVCDQNDACIKGWLDWMKQEETE